jgi:hypothetical protein
MKLVDTVYKSLHEYPSLYYYKDHPTLSDFEISRLAVLEHLFLTGGNGYAWVKDGYLVEMEKAIDTDFTWPIGWIAEGPPYGVLKYEDRTWPPKRTYKTLALRKEIEDWFHNPELVEEDPYDLYAYEYGFMKNRSKEFPFSIYPISTDMLVIPDFIQKDWLEGFIEIVEFSITYFESPKGLDGNNQKVTAKVRHNSLMILRKMLDTLKDKLKEVA